MVPLTVLRLQTLKTLFLKFQVRIFWSICNKAQGQHVSKKVLLHFLVPYQKSRSSKTSLSAKHWLFHSSDPKIYSPRVIVSDNGRNFVGAVRELMTNLSQFDQQKISDQLFRDNRMKLFSTVRIPLGGAWERLVQSPKQIFYSVIGSQMLTEREFHSFLTQAEKILNSRPLTYVPDRNFSYQPITQNIFLVGRLHKSLRHYCQSPKITTKTGRSALPFHSSSGSDYCASLYPQWLGDPNG